MKENHLYILLVIVDAREKKSASIYELDVEDEDTEYDFGDFLEI